MVIGTLAGLASAIHLVAPDFFANIPWLEFGRIRQVHTNTVLFGFVTAMSIGAGLYMFSRVVNKPLVSEAGGNFAALLFSAGVLIGDVGLLLGYTQAREYADYAYVADAFIEAAFVALMVVVLMTFFHRREKVIYVSAWYTVGASIWAVITYFIGNVMWRPPLGAESGLFDALLLWFYGHNVFGLLVTPLALAISYYMFPRIAKAPLYSQLLGIIGFWTLLAFYAHIGGHHLLQTPVPAWLKAVTVADSFAMMLPVATALVNFWYTCRGRFANFVTDPAAKLLLAGSIWYAIVCIQGPLQSLPWVQRVTHFNNWVVGHSHIAVLGFTGFIALAGMYYVLPNVCGRQLYSVKMVNIQYWLLLIGLLGFFAVLTAAGLVQGQGWDNGASVYRILPEVKPYMVLRLASGIFVIAGAFVGLYNVVMTLWRGKVLSE